MSNVINFPRKTEPPVNKDEMERGKWEFLVNHYTKQNEFYITKIEQLQSMSLWDRIFNWPC